MFTFSRTWTPPRDVLKLCGGLLALLSVRYLVADAGLPVEDLLICVLVIFLFGVDTETLLEDLRNIFNGSDCSAWEPTGNNDKGGPLSQLMIARLNRIPNSAVFESRDYEMQIISISISNTQPIPSRHEFVNYFEVREEKDPFPDTSVPDRVDNDQRTILRIV